MYLYLIHYAMSACTAELMKFPEEAVLSTAFITSLQALSKESSINHLQKMNQSIYQSTFINKSITKMLLYSGLQNT